MAVPFEKRRRRPEFKGADPRTCSLTADGEANGVVPRPRDHRGVCVPGGHPRASPGVGPDYWRGSWSRRGGSKGHFQLAVILGI